MADGDVLKDRPLSVRDCAHFHDLALALAETVPGKLAKRPFRRPFVRQNFPFDDHLRVRRHKNVGGFALDELERLTEQPTHNRTLVFVDGSDRETTESDGGMNADGESDRQWLSVRFCDALKLPEVLGQSEMNRGGIAPLNH